MTRSRKKFFPYDDPWEEAGFTVQEERTENGEHQQFRVTMPSGAVSTLTRDDLSVLTDLLVDVVADVLEDA